MGGGKGNLVRVLKCGEGGAMDDQNVSLKLESEDWKDVMEWLVEEFSTTET
jgi:hypothetical protein